MSETDEFDEMAKKAMAEARKRLEKAKAEGKGKTTTTTTETKEDGKVVRNTVETSYTIEEVEVGPEEFERMRKRLDISPQGDDKIDELEEAIGNLRFRLEESKKETLHFKKQVTEQIGNIEALLHQRKDLEAKLALKRAEVTKWKTAALCEKPRGSCRNCKTKNCYHKTEEDMSRRD